MSAGIHSAVSTPRRVRLLLGLLVVALVAVGFLPQPAGAADPRLEEALQRRQAIQAQLDELLQRLLVLDEEVRQVEAQLAALLAQRDSERAQAVGADSAMREQARASYIRGSTDPGLSMLTSANPQQAAEQARMLTLLAHRSREEFESSSAAGIRTGVAAEQVAFSREELEARKAELAEERAEAERLVAEAQAEEQRVRDTIAAEEEAARRAAEEAARRAAEQRQAAAPRRGAGGGAAQPPATINGDVACPVGQPRSYSDTWGAPRSGGRSHKGTDILAPHATPLYAYENGVVTRMNSNSLGGISLYLKGDSGNLYYYTHLSGYVSGISAGERVTVGQHIAMNGATGNAPVPHLHFEVMPGGGGNVNPYPYVVRACG